MGRDFHKGIKLMDLKKNKQYIHQWNGDHFLSMCIFNFEACAKIQAGQVESMKVYLRILTWIMCSYRLVKLSIYVYDFDICLIEF